MSRNIHRFFWASILSFILFFSFFQSSQAGFFDWFKWFKKIVPQNNTEVVPSVKKASSSKFSSSNYSSVKFIKSPIPSSLSSGYKSFVSSKSGSSDSKSSSSFSESDDKLDVGKTNLNNSSISIPSITVLSPNGGEVFTEGSQVGIRWKTNGLSSSQKLNIVLNVGSSGMGETIAKDVINNGSYLWTAKPFESFYSPEGGSQIVLSGKYTISVVCSQQNYANCKFNRNFDTSDSMFMITKQSSSAPLSITVQVPNGGEVWGDNHSEYIYFTSNLSKQPLKIWAQNTQSGLVTIVDESYVTIDSKSNRAGWSPSRAPLAAGSYKICVGTDIRNPLDCSDAAFAVVSSANTTTPSITVIPPNKEEALIASTTTSQEIKISRDAKRIADINNLMLALELYFDIKREYPLTASWKTDLAPTYIGTIPKDPLTADYTYERCTPTLYHLGTALEESTNSKLTNNNKTAVSGCSGAWGSNTSVCSGVPGLNQGYFCYDVKP